MAEKQPNSDSKRTPRNNNPPLRNPRDEIPPLLPYSEYPSFRNRASRPNRPRGPSSFHRDRLRFPLPGTEHTPLRQRCFRPTHDPVRWNPPRRPRDTATSSELVAQGDEQSENRRATLPQPNGLGLVKVITNKCESIWFLLSRFADTLRKNAPKKRNKTIYH